MISLIVCHRNKAQLASFKTSAEETIAGEYEFVIIDNSQNKYSIFEAYNLGVQKAKGDILAFCHEDILFHTNGWDQLLASHFAHDDKLGLVGVVGGTALPAAPAPWWNKHEMNIHFINVIQHWKSNENINKWDTNIALDTNNRIHHSNNPSGNIINNAVAVDGFFMACPKTIFSSITFDEHTFKGFHCYDIDTCLQVINCGHKVAVVHDILIEHSSEGSVNKKWAQSAVICARKWNEVLPLTINNYSEQQLFNYNLSTLLTFCYWNIDHLADRQLRNIISEFLPNNKWWPKSRTHLQLLLWKKLGYKLARLPFKFLKPFFND